MVSFFIISESFAQEDWSKFRVVGDFYLPNGKIDYQIQEIPYKIINGKIIDIVPKNSENKISINVDSNEDGILEIKIPRNIVDASIGNDDDEFFIIEDNQEIDFEEKTLTNLDAICHRHLVIPFTKDTSSIEIIGTSALSSLEFKLHPYYQIDCLTNPSPKVQIKSGILPENVSCIDDFKLVIKSSDNSSACVKPSSLEKLIKREWASHEIEAKPKPQILKYSPVLFPGTGVTLKNEDFTSNKLLRLEYLEQDLERLLEDPDIKRDDRNEYYDELEKIQLYAQQAFDSKVSWELIEILWEKRGLAVDSISTLGKDGVFPIVSLGSISIGQDAYSVDEKHTGNPTALRIGIMKDQFTKENLETVDKMIREHLGDEIDIVYYKGNYITTGTG